MPLNYSKWDMLELSDDSDIEEHPNVDKKSMIRWKQRDIHEKREQRKLKIAKLQSELSLNSVLRPRIQTVVDGVSSKGVDFYRSVQRRIKETPSDEKPNTGAANQPTYDMMLGQLLSDVFREGCWIVDGSATSSTINGQVLKDGKKVEESTGQPDWSTGEIPENKKEPLGKVLGDRLRWHLTELDKRDKEIKVEIQSEEKEEKKKITSEHIKEGWSTSSISKPTQSVIDDKPKPAPQPKKKAPETTESIEVLNPGASSSSSSAPANAISNLDIDDDEEDVPDFGPLTPAARAFVQIPLGDYEKSYAFIQKDSSVLSESSHDSLLAEAFDAERRGDKALAKRCVHQSLLVNYCRQLGRDGVGLFFQKMIQKNPKSITMFNDDLERTYGRIESRTKEIIAEEEAAGEVEQIQLVAEDPNVEIGFRIPDGPPPEELRVEGEGADQIDIEDLRKWLQRQWEIYEAFPEKLKAALQTKKLDEVNKVLARMKVAEAETVVEQLQEGGMLSFSESGVRDMTGQ